jgi:hypothetical protein
MVVVSKVLESHETIACKNLLFLSFVHVFVYCFFVCGVCKTSLTPIAWKFKTFLFINCLFVCLWLILMIIWQWRYMCDVSSSVFEQYWCKSNMWLWFNYLGAIWKVVLSTICFLFIEQCWCKQMTHQGGYEGVGLGVVLNDGDYSFFRLLVMM